jgi:glutaminase
LATAKGGQGFEAARWGRLLSVVALALVVISSPALAQKTAKKGKAAAAGPNYQEAVNAAYAKFKDLHEGKNADYIPALAEVDPNIFGIALVTVDGKVYATGDTSSQVSIQSISKVFTMARVVEDQGTGQVFNSIVAVEQYRGGGRRIVARAARAGAAEDQGHGGYSGLFRSLLAR